MLAQPPEPGGQQAQRSGDLAKAGELSYGRIPALEKQLAEAQGAAANAMLREPLESPDMADFVANLERINALAEASPGYLWRLQDETGDATASG